MKCFIIIFICFSTVYVYGQDSVFYKQVIKNEVFKKVDKKKVSADVLKVLGYDSYDRVGTKKVQTGCTSGKRIVINWIVKSDKDLYVLSLSSCGAWSEIHNYCIFKNELFEIPINLEVRNFNQLRKEYLKL